MVKIAERDKVNREGVKPGRTSAKVPKSSDKSKQKEGKRFRSSIICYGCGEEGHGRRQCQSDKRGGGTGGNGGVDEITGKSDEVSCGATGRDSSSTTLSWMAQGRAVYS